MPPAHAPVASRAIVSCLPGISRSTSHGRLARLFSRVLSGLPTTHPKGIETMSTFIPSVILAAPLGTDSAAMCTGIGATGRLTLRRRLVIAGTLTAFEAFMPVIGVMLAGVIGPELGESARYLGGALLAILGVYMLRSGDSDESASSAPLGAGALILAGLAVSVDEIAVGVSLGLGGVNLPVLVSTIGVIVFTATMLGLTLGGMLSAHAERAGKLAGYALILLGALLAVGVL